MSLKDHLLLPCSDIEDGRVVVASVCSSENRIHSLLSISVLQIFKHDNNKSYDDQKSFESLKYGHNVSIKALVYTNKSIHISIYSGLLDGFIKMSGLNFWNDQLVISLWGETTL